MHTINPDIIEEGARAVIDRYLSLPIGTKPSCPYFNNRRRGSKSNLRVLVGKGKPEEIAEECEIRALQNRVTLSSLSTDKLKEFLVSQDLGVDCSGFAYHVLDAALSERRGKRLSGYIRTRREGFVGKLIARLRPAENIGVATFADERNSGAISAAEAKAGDMVVFMGTGRDRTYNHVLVITGVEKIDDAVRLSYAHSYAWPSDGPCGHGVREGHILIHGNNLLGGTWKENGMVGEDNYTHQSARDARESSIRRLRVFME
ncbi:MAG: hypothetical protein WC763_03455 [Candidatus Paceibacterota bacterium]|jgi:hypothetical protein